LIWKKATLKKTVGMFDMIMILWPKEPSIFGHLLIIGQSEICKKITLTLIFFMGLYTFLAKQKLIQ
jgi:hypothetical protein